MSSMPKMLYSRGFNEHYHEIKFLQGEWNIEPIERREVVEWLLQRVRPLLLFIIYISAILLTYLRGLVFILLCDSICNKAIKFFIIHHFSFLILSPLLLVWIILPNLNNRIRDDSLVFLKNSSKNVQSLIMCLEFLNLWIMSCNRYVVTISESSFGSWAVLV